MEDIRAFGADPSLGFPSAKDQHKQRIRSIVQSFDLREKCFDDFEDCDMYPREIDTLCATWASFQGPVHNENNFAVCIDLSQGEGEWFAWAHYKNGRVRVKVGPWEDVPEGLLRIVERPAQRKGVKHIPRNSKCPCGSNKKYKKCCGR